MSKIWDAIKYVVECAVAVILAPIAIASQLLVWLLLIALIASPLILIGFIVWRIT